jgi:pantetheine-phosphate adenylyltransferase
MRDPTGRGGQVHDRRNAAGLGDDVLLANEVLDARRLGKLVARGTDARVTVAVAYNPNKDAAMFTPPERVAMIEQALADVGDRVIADSFTGLLVDYAERIGAQVLIRGLRAVSDFEYELQMAQMNKTIGK